MRWWWWDQGLRRDIHDLKEAILSLRQEKQIVSQEVELSNEIVRLKTALTELKIEKGRVEEANAKEARELTHMIGLEKKRQEVEITQAKKDATLAVREENLAADRKRFDEQMAFREKRFDEEVGYLKEMLAQILTRLPTVTVDRTVEGKRRG
jgi:hypothetical protein